MSTFLYKDLIERGFTALFFVTQERDHALSQVVTILKQFSFAVVVYNVKQFGVEEAGLLNAEAKSFGMQDKVFIISAAHLHWVAQNKILKTLEDGHNHVRFIFITESLDSVLPTIISRVQVYDMSEVERISSGSVLFLSTKRTLRMDIPEVKSLLAGKDKDNKKDREEMFRFLRELYQASVFLKMDTSSQALILHFLVLASSSSANFKMMYECLALSLPSVVG